MKKFVRRTLAALLAIVMTASVCCIAVPAATTVAGDVVYASDTFHTLTFNPKNGYIAAPFAYTNSYRGQLNTMKNGAGTVYCNSTANTAVAGAINGSYFDMTTGVLNGSNMTNGEIICWSEPWQFSSGGTYYEPMIVFKSDGTITGCDSNLSVHATIGSNFACNISYINKDSYIGADILYYFDRNSVDGTSPSMSTSGRWAIFKKTSANIPLALNVPYTGTLLRVETGTSVSFNDDEFALFFVGTTYFGDLTEGTPVTINITEEIAASKEIMNNAIGFMQCTGYLIKDGVDHTDLYSYIGPGPLNNSTDGHSVTLTRGWTGMGIKADGSIVLMTSVGQSTMSAMADKMLSLGVVTAFRMDSGGSSQMRYGSTTVYSEGSRAVTEIIAIVNTEMMGNDSVKAELGELIERAESILGSDSTVAELVEARAAYNNNITADMRFSIGRLTSMFSAKGMLNTLVGQIASTDYSAYPDYKADLIQTTAIEAKRLAASAASTDAQCDAVTQTLSNLLSGSYDAGRLSLGAAYKSSTVNSTYPDNGGKELTNGDLYDYPNGSSNDRWVGFQSESAAGSNSTGAYAEVYVDMGEATNITAASVSARNRTDWGIKAPKKVEVLSSNDGKTFSRYLTLESTFDAVDGVDQAMFYTAEGTTTARYFVFRAYFDGDHIFLGEVSLYGDSSKAVGFDPVDVTNKSVDGTDTVTIFTPNFASTLTASNANLNWCDVVVCDYDATLGAYVVTNIYNNRGETTDVNIPDDGFVVAYFAEAGWAMTGDVSVGMYAYLNGVHIINGALDVLARVSFKAPVNNKVDDYEVFFGIITVGNGKVSPDNDYVRLHVNNVTVAQLIAASSDKSLVVRVNGSVITGNTVIPAGAVITDSNGATYTTYLFGDVSQDNKTTPVDYALLKRAYMGSYNVSEGIQMKSACVSGGTQIKALDYIMLKRYFIGTYVLP